jgi:hypothetical protein
MILLAYLGWNLIITSISWVSKVAGAIGLLTLGLVVLVILSDSLSELRRALSKDVREIYRLYDMAIRTEGQADASYASEMYSNLLEFLAGAKIAHSMIESVVLEILSRAAATDRPLVLKYIPRVLPGLTLRRPYYRPYFRETDIQRAGPSLFAYGELARELAVARKVLQTNESTFYEDVKCLLDEGCESNVFRSVRGYPETRLSPLYEAYYSLLSWNTDGELKTAVVGALDVFAQNQDLEHGVEMVLIYRTLNDLIAPLTFEEILSIELELSHHILTEPLHRHTIEVFQNFKDIVDILSRSEKVSLPSKLPYYAEALEALDRIDKRLDDVSQPEKRILDFIVPKWRKIILERIKELKGRAHISIKLATNSFGVSEDEITLPLVVRNEGTGVAENVTATLDRSELASKIIPLKTEVNLGLIPPEKEARAEFRIRPLIKETLRIPFVVAFDDLEKKGKEVEFADTIEFYEEGKRERFKLLTLNPYIAGRPLRTGEMFFGREDVFQYIQENLEGRYQDNVIVLHGQRRTGKTSVLYQLSVRLGDEYVPVLVDMQGITGGVDYFFYDTAFRIIEALERKGVFIDEPDREPYRQEPEGYFKNRFLREVRRKIGDRHLLLMIDEFEVIEENIKRGVLDVGLLDYFRNLMQHSPNLDFIFAGTHKIEEMVRDYWSVFFNLALYKKISFLDNAATEQLITQPVMGYFQYDQYAMEKIKQVTGGHPYFTQLLCRKLVDYRNERRLNYINFQHVNDVIDAVVEEGEINIAYIWQGSSLEERLFLVALNETIQLEGAASVTDVDKFLKRKDIATDISAAMKHLEARDVIIEQDGRCEFTIDLFRHWIEENYNLERTLMEANHAERESLLSPKGH